MPLRITLPRLVHLATTAILKEPPPHVVRLTEPYYSPYYYLLFLLTWTSCGGVAVELGVETGRGSACLAAGSSNCRVFGFDPARHELLDGRMAPFRNFTFIQQSSVPADPAKFEYSRWGRINFLFLDTEHTYTQVKNEFEAYRPFLQPGSVVLFDDLHAMNDGVLNYFASLPYPKFQDDRLHPICGFGGLVYQ